MKTVHSHKLFPSQICQSPLALCEDLQVIEDPRRKQAVRHPLIGIMIMALCAIAAGADGWDDIADTAKLHFEWFKEVTVCAKQPPSSDTFRRVIQSLKPQCLQKALEAWLKRSGLEKRSGRQICFDGKALRGSKSVHIVNAFNPEDRVTLGQISVGEKQNEITALPSLQEVLDLSGTTCSGDAMFTQKQIVKDLQSSEADYVLSLKANQPKLLEKVQKEFAGNYASILRREMVEKNRGWVEERILRCSTRVGKVDPKSEWKGLQAVIELETKKTKEEEFSIETRYYLTSLDPDLDVVMKIIRSHWGIENILHRSLDVFFKEDACQVREKIGAENLSMLRKLAGSILQRIDPQKTLKSKMKAMLGSRAFRMRFLTCDW